MMAYECDSIVKMAIPAVRIAVARVLSKEYGFGQELIAKRLGVTQASVSKYLNGRHSKSTTALMALVRKRGFDKRIARAVAAKGSLSRINNLVDEAASDPYIIRNTPSSL